MISFEEVEEMVGHALAAGNSNSAVELTISQLEQAVEAKGWVDVCKEKYQFEEKFLRFFIRCFYSDFLLFL